MKNKLQLIAKINLFLLMFVVVGRPLVVEASTFINPPANPSFALKTHPIRSKSTAVAARIKRQPNHQLSKLKFLPKNTVGVYHFAPQFAKFNFSLGLGSSTFSGPSIRSNSSRNFLVLRI